MNYRKISQWLALVFIALLLVACGAHISSGGIELKVISATKQDTYDLGMQAYTPNSPNDGCLVVEAAIDKGDPKIVQEWKVLIIDESGRESQSNITSIKTFTASQKSNVMWLFVIARTSQSLTLRLPDGQKVDLTSIVK